MVVWISWGEGDAGPLDWLIEGADWSGGRLEWPTQLMFTGMGVSLHSFYRCFAGLVALGSCRKPPTTLVDTAGHPRACPGDFFIAQMGYMFVCIQTFYLPWYLHRVIPEQRIRELCAQLLRAENPAVLDAVTAQLKTALEQYTNRETDQGLVGGEGDLKMV
jgi:hypothetical protein